MRRNVDAAAPRRESVDGDEPEDRDRQTKQRAVASGAHEVLEKPLDDRELLQAIRRAKAAESHPVAAGA